MKIRKAFKRFGLPRRNPDLRHIVRALTAEDHAIQDGTLLYKYPGDAEIIISYFAPYHNSIRAARIRIVRWLRNPRHAKQTDSSL